MNVIFDLDGTLANCDHRLPMIGGEDPDWEAFYLACTADTPIYAAINTLIAFRHAGARVEIWTGRSDFVRSETERWLQRHAINAPVTRMREHGDHRRDDVLKREWLNDLLLRESRKPDLVFEDRSRVVAMWRKAGIACFQVREGDY